MAPPCVEAGAGHQRTSCTHDSSSAFAELSSTSFGLSPVLAAKCLCLGVQEHLLSFSRERVGVKDSQHTFIVSSEGRMTPAVVMQEEAAAPAHAVVSRWLCSLPC